MRIIDKAVFAVARLAAWLSGAILVAMVIHILVEIVLRSFFDTSTYVLDEFIGYGVAAMTFLTLAYALEEGSLIRVNIILVRTHGTVRRTIEVICASSTLVLVAYLGWYVFRNWKRDWVRGAVSPSIAEVPMWIPEGLVVVGYALLIVQLCAYLLRLLLGGRVIGDSVDGG